MSLYSETDKPKFLTEEQLKNCIYVSPVEAATQEFKAKGLVSAGWWLYTSYKDSAGADRHKAELLIGVTASQIKPIRPEPITLVEKVIEQPVEETPVAEPTVAVELVVEPVTVTIITNPDSVDVVAPAAATFSVEAVTSNEEPLTYKWQESTANSTKIFLPLSENGTYVGTNTATLTITDTSNLNKRKYRVVVSNGSVTETSKFASLSVNEVEVEETAIG